MHPRERLAYSPIEKRPPLKFPKGVRLIVWPVLALEEWDMGRPMGHICICCTYKWYVDAAMNMPS